MLEFGVVGLGRIGGGLAWQAAGKGMKAHGYDLFAADPELIERGVIVAESLEAFIAAMERPRKVFVYIHAGPAIDEMIETLAALLDEGDVIVDGGNSYWGDSIRRHARLRERGLHLIDLGTSGGVSGARFGACFMAGGSPEALDLVEPILLGLCTPGGYVRAGGPGSGHFVKLVHNGIEFGMLQAIGEGVDLLRKYDETLNIPDVLSCWQNGSVVRSWLMDLMHDGLMAQANGLDSVPAYVEDTGEVNWLVGDALRMEVPIPIIAGSVMQLFASRDGEKDWARAVAVMRNGFGGHPFGPKPALAVERQVSRVGDIYKPEMAPPPPAPAPELGPGVEKGG